MTGPLIDIHSNTHVFRVYVFKSLKFNQRVCSTISLLFNLISITKILQAMHESKGLISGCNGAKVKVR